jgi:hypothetical protein
MNRDAINRRGFFGRISAIIGGGMVMSTLARPARASRRRIIVFPSSKTRVGYGGGYYPGVGYPGAGYYPGTGFYPGGGYGGGYPVGGGYGYTGWGGNSYPRINYGGYPPQYVYPGGGYGGVSVGGALNILLPMNGPSRPWSLDALCLLEG